MTLIIFLFILSLSCNKRNKEKSSNELSIFDKDDKVPDSIKIDDIIIYNLFKYQILAHKNNLFDSTLIINKVYNSQPKIWKELYGVLFDYEMFTTTQGMVKWNKEIFHENKDSIESRVNTLLDIKFDSTLQASLEGMKKLTGRTPKNIRLSIILAPVEGIGFGGMENDAFIFDLLGNNFDVINIVQEGIPHEFNHFIYEGRDILTDEKLFERNYTIPPAQTLEEVIGYYARQIAQNIKLPSQFDLLAPKVRDFFERKAFGEVVNLNDEKVIRAMSSNISSYVVIKEFEKALREIVIEHKEPQLPSPLLVFARRHIVQAYQQTSSSHSRTKK